LLKVIHPKLFIYNLYIYVVPDALSRIQINNLTESNESVSAQNTQHSAESSFENVIQETRKPLNQFKQQLLIATGRH